METDQKHTIVIRASEWHRGQTGNSALQITINPDGSPWRGKPGTEKRCCLGIDAKACGFDEAYLNVGTPLGLLFRVASATSAKQSFKQAREKLYEQEGPLGEYFRRYLRPTDSTVDGWEHRPEATECMRHNDHEEIDDETRIERLRGSFAPLNVEIDWRPNE